MSQIATFFNPVALPTAAGATAFESNAAAPGESFAAALLDLNALLGVVDPNAPAPVDILQNIELLVSVAAPFTLPTASAEVIPGAGIDATLAAQFTLLQGINLETIQQQPQATAGIDANKTAAPTGASAVPELRGSLAAAVETAVAAQQSQTVGGKPATEAAVVATAKDLATVREAATAPRSSEHTATAQVADPAKRATPAVPGANAVPAASEISATSATPAAPATPATSATQAAPAIPAASATPAATSASATRAAASTPAPQSSTPKRATPTAAATGEQPRADAQNAKPIEAPSTSAVPALTSEPQGLSPDNAQQTATNSTQQPTPSVSATVAPVLPTIIAAQQLNSALIDTPQAAVPLDALAVHIAGKFEQGSSEFEIRLHPADLGQLDITLTVAEDGRVQASLRAERPETLELLQRDARTLEQQLRHAGLDVGSNALSFSLSNGHNQRHAPNPAWPAFADANDAASLAQDQALSHYVAVSVRDGIDIRV